MVKSVCLFYFLCYLVVVTVSGPIEDIFQNTSGWGIISCKIVILGAKGLEGEFCENCETT